MTTLAPKGGRWCVFRAAHMELQTSAYWVLHSAIRRGQLKRQPCVVCGKERVEAHHEDYSRPLDVIWLCRWHHAQRHTGESIAELQAPAVTG